MRIETANTRDGAALITALGPETARPATSIERQGADRHEETRMVSEPSNPDAWKAAPSSAASHAPAGHRLPPRDLRPRADAPPEWRQASRVRNPVDDQLSPVGRR
ncbi:hypothetical protein Airi01_102020 [Actinoallomurus iriomotensis]|uniref:Uncharacterized protein n=1 Tax=Actinoallomurus iriomotensis TaxID=478107 RepID=A0A9W6VVM0_9ACTN|nr:hypothetical protein Airi01_102020 [Actinoallomurus iriomotensis]